MLHYGRGRPRGQRQFAPDMTRLLYLFFVSKKYGLEPHKFFECFLYAWTHERSSYKDISIQCRQKTENDGVFLVTQDQKVITQLRLTGATLKHLPEVDFESPPWNKYVTLNKMEKSMPVDMKVKDVNSGVKWVNLKAKVIEKSIARTVFSRYGGNPLGLSNSTISDGTGSIKLPLWNAQINLVSIGDTVQIENGRVRTFRGELQVSVGKSGKLTVIENQSK
jgi:replication factor A1